MKEYLKSEKEIRSLLIEKMIDESLNVKKVAAAAGISYGALKFFLDDKVDPSFTTLARISKFLKPVPAKHGDLSSVSIPDGLWKDIEELAGKRAVAISVIFLEALEEYAKREKVSMRTRPSEKSHTDEN